MELPEHLVGQAFDKQFTRGAIFYTEVQFGSERKKKYLVVLNNHPNDSRTLIFLSTSKTGFYERHPHVEHVRIAAGQIPCFPLETIIDCRTVYDFDRRELKVRFQQRLLSFAGNMPADIMQKIDQLIAASRFISQAHKKAILGWK